jgi:hypothetical protein
VRGAAFAVMSAPGTSSPEAAKARNSCTRRRLARPSGFEPLTYGSGASDPGWVSVASVRKAFAAPVLQGSEAVRAGPRAVGRMLRSGKSRRG